MTEKINGLNSTHAIAKETTYGVEPDPSSASWKQLQEVGDGGPDYTQTIQGVQGPAIGGMAAGWDNADHGGGVVVPWPLQAMGDDSTINDVVDHFLEPAGFAQDAKVATTAASGSTQTLLKVASATGIEAGRLVGVDITGQDRRRAAVIVSKSGTDLSVVGLPAAAALNDAVSTGVQYRWDEPQEKGVSIKSWPNTGRAMQGLTGAVLEQLSIGLENNRVELSAQFAGQKPLWAGRGRLRAALGGAVTDRTVEVYNHGSATPHAALKMASGEIIRLSSDVALDWTRQTTQQREFRNVLRAQDSTAVAVQALDSIYDPALPTVTRQNTAGRISRKAMRGYFWEPVSGYGGLLRFKDLQLQITIPRNARSEGATAWAMDGFDSGVLGGTFTASGAMRIDGGSSDHVSSFFMSPTITKSPFLIILELGNAPFGGGGMWAVFCWVFPADDGMNLSPWKQADGVFDYQFTGNIGVPEPLYPTLPSFGMSSL